MIHWAWLVLPLAIGYLVGAGMMRYAYSKQLMELVKEIEFMKGRVEEIKERVEAKKK